MNRRVNNIAGCPPMVQWPIVTGRLRTQCVQHCQGDNPTLGLIPCPDKNDAVVRYTLGEQLKRNIFTSRYQLYLPTEEELQQEMRRELRFLAPPARKSTKKRTRES